MRRASVDPGSLQKDHNYRLSECLQRRPTLPGFHSAGSADWHNNEFASVDSFYDNRPSITEVESFQSSVNVFDLTEFDEPRFREAVENLQKKINRTLELIQAEQKVQADNVNDYLELSIKPIKQNLQQLKSSFEKKNQKSSQVIQQLQRKVDFYNKKLVELEIDGALSKEKEVLKNVGNSLKTFVTKPAEIAHLIKHKLGGSMEENLNSNKLSDDSKENDNELNFLHCETKLTTHDLIEDQHLQMNNNSPPHRSPFSHSSGKDNPPPRPPSIPLTSSPSSNVVLTAAAQLKDLQDENERLRTTVNEMKKHMYKNFAEMKQTLEMEREMCQQVEEQVNDLSELHQHEMANIRQEVFSLEEKMLYHLEDKTRDMQELLESFQTRMGKLEQQYYQLSISDGHGYGGFSIGKIINVFLALISFIIILITMLASLLNPFLATRLRYFLTFLCVLISVAVWRNWEFISWLGLTYASDWLPAWIFQNDTTGTTNTEHSSV